MQELINIGNDELVTEKQLIEVIGKAVAKEKYEIASNLLMFLNQERIKVGKNAYTVRDVLLMNWEKLMPTSVPKSFKSIYIGEFSDGTIKIGVSNTPLKRLNTLAKQKGFEVTKVAYSKPIVDSFKVERRIHNHFKAHRLEGEYFICKFEDVANYINNNYATMQEVVI